MAKTIYEELQEKCREKKISVRRLAELAGVRYETITSWKRNTPKSIETYNKLTNQLNKI